MGSQPDLERVEFRVNLSDPIIEGVGAGGWAVAMAKSDARPRWLSGGPSRAELRLPRPPCAQVETRSASQVDVFQTGPGTPPSTYENTGVDFALN